MWEKKARENLRLLQENITMAERIHQTLKLFLQQLVREREVERERGFCFVWVWRKKTEEGVGIYRGKW